MSGSEILSLSEIRDKLRINFTLPYVLHQVSHVIMHVILPFSLIIERWPEVINLSALGLPHKGYHFEPPNFLFCNSYPFK